MSRVFRPKREVAAGKSWWHCNGAECSFDELTLERAMNQYIARVIRILSQGMEPASIASLNDDRLRQENAAHAGTGGISRGNAALGFRPAFLDSSTLKIYPARFADGRPAPFHLLDGLPDEVVIDRLPSGRVVAAKASLISGFERRGFFYTRHAAARACAGWAI
jgi:hypothetical protein